VFCDLTFVDIVDELWWFILVLVVCGIDMAHICCLGLFFICSATEGEIASNIHFFFSFSFFEVMYISKKPRGAQLKAHMMYT
jgi:hypothetical protein